MPPQKTAQKKIKLRTASDVLSRLKWSDDEQLNAENTIMGYDCRIHGPMEKRTADYAGIDDGGDIPQHRIQYFRRTGSKNYEKLIFWDRNGRVDRLFGSGNCDDPVSSITVQNVVKAVDTMKRIAEEKAILAQQKAKRRARQQARKAQGAAAKLALATSSVSANQSTSISSPQESSLGFQRHVWYELDSIFVYDSSKSSHVSRRSNGFTSPKFTQTSCDLKFITWNVLFDLHRNEQDELVQGDDTLLNEQDSTSSRWQRLIDDLDNEMADVIALQEVTPRFVQQIQRCQWVKDQYVLSAVSYNLCGVETYGNLILWKATSFQECRGLHLCCDQGRNRGLLVSLLRNKIVFNVANVHLPADKRDNVTGETRDRTQARKREFAAMVSKLQVLEQTQRKQNLYPVPFIMGDFNFGEDEPTIFQCDHLVDAWLHPSNETQSDGFTFDWKRNERAKKTRQHGHRERDPRRIDRIVIGNQEIVAPIHSNLIDDSSEGLPPSDHFGVSISFRIKSPSTKMQPILYTPSKVEHNVWATTAVPTTDSLLALVFEDQDSLRLYDPSSTLPLAHITLLNGFVDLSTSDNLALATQAVTDAVHQSLHSSNPSQEWTLDIGDKLLNVFEHRESATLVCTPNKTRWLHLLYETLRVNFSSCDEQEQRFADGWTPHLSLGKYSTTTEARTEFDKLVSNGAWKNGISLKGFGIGLFRRDAASRKFFPVSTVPLVDRSKVIVKETKAFLQTAGLLHGKSFERLSKIVLGELESTCQHVTEEMWQGELTSKVLLYGSQALGVALPGLSDIDAVVQLNFSGDEMRNINGSKFLRLVQSRLEQLHSGSKIRLRVSSLAGCALYVLTIKLAPGLPAVDLLLARTTGETLDVASQQALDSIDDSQLILQRIQSLGMKASIFQGAVRMVKLWAHRRGIYGSSMGYLGGGGWAVLMAGVLEDITQWNELIDVADDALSARKIAMFFFREVFNYWSNARVVTLQGTNLSYKSTDQRNNMVVLAPKSGGNFGRSSTRSTTQQTWTELRKVAQLLNGDSLNSDCINKLETCLLPHIVCGKASGNTIILALKVNIKSCALKPADIKARGAILGLSTTVALERILPACNIRPDSNVRRKNGAFWFVTEIALSGTEEKKLLAEFVESRSRLLQQEEKLGNLPFQLVQMTPG